MPLQIVSVADRPALGANDEQTWTGWGRENDRLSSPRRRSSVGLCWCGVEDFGTVWRFAQPSSHRGHFGTVGEKLIGRDIEVEAITLTFDPPLLGLGFEVEPRPDRVGPALKFQVRSEFTGADGSVAVLDGLGDWGTVGFVGVRCTQGEIAKATVSVSLTTNGAEAPVAFAINRLSLLAPGP